jgi:hypothetical protein
LGSDPGTPRLGLVEAEGGRVHSAPSYLLEGRSLREGANRYRARSQWR